jgi:prepilin-type N-terminal cleavage/methylation domain-containing protein
MTIEGKSNGEAGRRCAWAFTLIELLVVVAIIAVLGGLVMPGVTRSLSSGKAAGCSSNARQIALALIAFDNDHQQLPWSTEGFYAGMFDLMGVKTNSKLNGTNWVQKLDYFKYIPRADNATPWTKGVWRCPGAGYAEVLGKDAKGNVGNLPSYGICTSVFRPQNAQDPKTFDNVPQRPLKLSRIPRPDRIWMVGDCGRPVQNSAKGSGRYYRTDYTYGRPGSVGGWDFTSSATPAAQPALRHIGAAVFATFDGHITKVDWPGMLIETNDFTARKDSSF